MAATNPTYATPLVRSIKNGQVSFEDSAGATNAIICTFMDGGLSGDMLKKSYDVVRHRGVIQQFLEGDDQVHEITLKFNLVEFASVTTGTAFNSNTPFEIARISSNNTFTFASTTTGTTGEVTLFNVKLVINSPGGTAVSETIVWSKCLCPTITMDEDYPDKWTMTIQSRGGPPTITYA